MPNAKHCFWHDSTEDKKGADIKDRLEERARTGVVMEGFELKEANLENLNLVSHLGEPYQLINSNLSRANLHKAHLYKVDLSGSSLLKADLSHANLHRANLSNSNLLGVNFKNAHLEHVIWGSHLYQEQKARELPAEASRYYEEAEEVARNIRRQCEQQGMHGIVGHFFYREVVFRRMQMPRFSMRRLISRLVDLVSKYGESPLRVVCSSGLLVMCCSLIYFCTGIQEEGVRIQYQPAADAMTNLQHWSDCLYFSVVTFTTLGYGDLTPFGWSRVVAAIEAFTGSFSLALFVVLFVKKMTR
ncbi:hypothetical protein ACH42_09410 [Endozoicomonas sp. (ex Bugula neritina AB1)]|nr:hypothetical protein ACH42_09410 [Endozoicomonas sp. (ex Bugula neritina AB1)]